MTAPLHLRIESLVIHAASAREARVLADALPAALHRALHAASGAAASGGVIDAGAVRMPAGAPGLADGVAQRIVAAALGEGRGA